MPHSWIIYLILLAADISVAWMISESPLPLLMVSAGAAVFGMCWLVGRILNNDFAERTAPVLAMVFFVTQAWLFQTGQARVMLSELPLVFHLGMALHFWLWMSHSRERSLWIPLIAGAMIFWSTGSTEIYGSSKLLVRTLGALGLILPIGYRLLERSGKISPISVFAAISCAVFLASLVNPADRLSGQIFQWVNPGPGDSFLDDSAVDPNAITAGQGAIDGSSRELPKRVDLEMSDEIKAHLLVKDRSDFSRMLQKPIYLKTSSLAVFETPSRLAPDRRATWFLDSDDGLIDGRTFLEKAPEKSNVNYSVLINRELISTLPLIPGTERVDVDAVYQFANGWWQIEPRGTRALIRFSAAAPLLSGNSIRSSDQALKAGEIGKFPYRTAPVSGLSLNIRDLTRKIAKSDAPLADRLRAIEDYFETEIKYSLNYRNRKNLDPLENFLFEEKRGHCELFASATALMLRHLDIPSRVSYGFMGGEFDLENRLITFRDRDYHAWPEIFIEGQGWQVFDTTPSTADRILPPQASASLGSAKVDLAAYEDIGRAEQTFASERSQFAILLDSILLFVSRHFVILLGMIAALASLWTFYAKRKSTETEAGHSGMSGKFTGSREDDLPAFASELAGIGNRMGTPKQSSQTWLEFLSNLKKRGICNGEFDAMTDYLYQILYCSGNRDQKLESQYAEIVANYSPDEESE